jgi:hypothetical protein
MIRAAGPTYLLARYGDRATAAPEVRHDGYCDGCRRLSDHPATLRAIGRAGSGIVGELLDQRAAQIQVDAGPVEFVRRHGCTRYADLVAPAAGARDQHAGPA